MPSRAIVVAVLLLLVRVAAAEDRSQLRGRVLDRGSGSPVEGALVMVAGGNGLDRVLTTDREGRYAAELAAGKYNLIFVFGTSRTSANITLEPGRLSMLDGRVDTAEGEVIIIREKVAPPVRPKPQNYKPHKAPPYSDRAIESDAWTRAWLLLDVSETGVVERFKFLKRPGFDLEQIATTEAFKLRFDPARDTDGRPVRAWVVWGIEWPSWGWLVKLNGTATGMPKVIGFPPRRQDDYIPCAGTAPWHMGSVHKTYKDCAKPDLSKVAHEAWVTP